jgi:hypothetical protein
MYVLIYFEREEIESNFVRNSFGSTTKVKVIWRESNHASSVVTMGVVLASKYATTTIQWGDTVKKRVEKNNNINYVGPWDIKWQVPRTSKITFLESLKGNPGFLSNVWLLENAFFHRRLVLQFYLRRLTEE